MQKEINFYQEMASEHRLQEYSKGTVPLYTYFRLKIWVVWGEFLAKICELTEFVIPNLICLTEIFMPSLNQTEIWPIATFISGLYLRVHVKKIYIYGLNWLW